MKRSDIQSAAAWVCELLANSLLSGLQRPTRRDEQFGAG
jgi:hypothetical protein